MTPLANQNILRNAAVIYVDSMDGHYIWGIATASFELEVKVGYIINT